MNRIRDDRGTAIIELVSFVVPVFVILLAVVMFIGRQTAAVDDVGAAAKASARAASLADTPDEAVTAAEKATTDSLQQEHVHCSTWATDVDVSGWAPGGMVAVTVTCNIATGDLVGVGLPGSKTFTARSVEAIDPFRETGDG